LNGVVSGYYIHGNGRQNEEKDEYHERIESVSCPCNIKGKTPKIGEG